MITRSEREKSRQARKEPGYWPTKHDPTQIQWAEKDPTYNQSEYWIPIVIVFTIITAISKAYLFLITVLIAALFPLVRALYNANERKADWLVKLVVSILILGCIKWVVSGIFSGNPPPSSITSAPLVAPRFSQETLFQPIVDNSNADNESKVSELITNYREMAKLGDLEAAYKLGMLYFEGEKTQKDFSQAVFWLKPVAESGDIRALIPLGFMYAQGGNGILKDLSTSFFYYRQSALKGDKDGQYLVGRMFLQGEGIEQSNQTAKIWLEKASMQGHNEAKEELAKLINEETSNPVPVNSLNEKQLLDEKISNDSEPTKKSILEQPVKANLVPVYLQKYLPTEAESKKEN